MQVPKESLRRRRRTAVLALRAAVAGAAVTAVVSVHAACSSPPAQTGAAVPRASGTAGHGTGKGGAPPPAARTREPSAAVSVLSASAPGDLTAQFAKILYGTSPVVIIAADTGPNQERSSATLSATRSPSAKPPAGAAAMLSYSASALPAAERAAAAAHAPLLLADRVTARLAAAVKALHPVAVLAVGLPPGRLAAELPGVRVVTQAAALPETAPPAPLRGLAVLIRTAAKSAKSPKSARSAKAAKSGGAASGATAATTATAAITATAQAAGATVIPLAGPDPRTSSAAIAELARLRPRHVMAIGAAFGPAPTLQARLAVAETGRQLPGGGQVMFPGRRLVALYGNWESPSLGVLGHQDVTASIARAKGLAALYRPLSAVPVVPAFEIIATVAEASPGPDGSYSGVTPVPQVRAWVRQATAAGLYVVLDLQPGRASLLTQAKLYRSVLTLPNVGLALDPEWKLQPGQKPLRQIGHVDITEVNSVIRWLSQLTARSHLPQKLLVLHQFRLDMLAGEWRLDTSRDNLSIVIHMDGQGTPGEKQATWNAVTAAAPRGVRFGFKDFYVMDHPMLSPRQTMAHAPAPVMISYQ